LFHVDKVSETNLNHFSLIVKITPMKSCTYLPENKPSKYQQRPSWREGCAIARREGGKTESLNPDPCEPIEGNQICKYGLLPEFSSSHACSCFKT
jgi:hypothetical protein